jgi:hypothetical protein
MNRDWLPVLLLTLFCCVLVLPAAVVRSYLRGVH